MYLVTYSTEHFTSLIPMVHWLNVELVTWWLRVWPWPHPFWNVCYKIHNKYNRFHPPHNKKLVAMLVSRWVLELKVLCLSPKSLNQILILSTNLTIQGVLNLSSNIMSSVGQCVDSGYLRHMTYVKSLFSRIQEQEGGMILELGDDATYLLRGSNSISFWIPSSGVLEISYILFVPSLRKNILSIYCMTNIQWRVSFEG